MGREILAARRRPAIAEAVLVIAALFLAEFLLSRVLPIPQNPSEGFRLGVTSVVRSAEIALLLSYWRLRFGNFSLFGRMGASAEEGVLWGIRFSLALGGFALLVEVLFRLLFSKSFLAILSPPASTAPLALLLAGVLIGPLFEELAFRGVLYSSFRRRYGPVFSTLVTALIFGALHYKAGSVPLVQIAGGIVFSMAYEKAGNLAAPLLVHSLGNLVIFSLPYFHLK